MATGENILNNADDVHGHIVFNTHMIFVSSQFIIAKVIDINLTGVYFASQEFLKVRAL